MGTINLMDGSIVDHLGDVLFTIISSGAAQILSIITPPNFSCQSRVITLKTRPCFNFAVSCPSGHRSLVQ